MQRVFFPMHQTAHRCDVMVICRSRIHMMNQTTFTFYTNMCLVSEVPCISLFCGVCFRVTFFLLILCGGRRFNECRIHDRSFLQNQTTFCLQLNDHIKRFLNRPIVSPSGTSSGKLMQQKAVKALLSRTSFMTFISARP